MINKIITLVVGSLLSMSASAGYVQYNFGGTNSAVKGYFIQHDDDKTIAYFALQIADSNGGFGTFFSPLLGDGRTLLTSARTHYDGLGPTSFSIHDDFGRDQDTYFDIDFVWDINGSFEYTARLKGERYFYEGWKPFAGTYYGSVTASIVPASTASAFDAMGGYEPAVPRIVPTYTSPYDVPEPSSLALMIIGALGAARVARRRKSLR